MTVLHQSIEQFRQTSERMMNISKQQFKRFEISGRDTISDYEVLLEILNAFTDDTETYYPKCNNVLLPKM